MVSAQQKAGIHRTDDPFLRRDDGELGEWGFKPFCNTVKESVAISTKALNHKITTEAFFSERSPGKPGKTIYLCRERKLPQKHGEEKKAFPLCLRGFLHFRAFWTATLDN